MGIWTHSLKFNVRTGGTHQLPQTTGDGFHSLLQKVVWDVGDNIPNPVLQLLHSVRFCPVHLLLCPAPQEKVTGHEIWTFCTPFVRSSSSQPISRKLLIQPGTYAQCKVWRYAIVHENKFIDVLSARYDRPHVNFQHLKIAFGIHGVMQKIWADDPSGRHSAPHGQKLRMTILDCLLTDCGIFSLHRTPPSLHSNHWIPHLIACSNLRSFLNCQAASHLCSHCACCLSRSLPTPSTRKL